MAIRGANIKRSFVTKKYFNGRMTRWKLAHTKSGKKKPKWYWDMLYRLREAVEKKVEKGYMWVDYAPTPYATNALLQFYVKYLPYGYRVHLVETDKKFSKRDMSNKCVIGVEKI
tara:strand:+ start:129 stop:470 length:342 start_codon:yes stop_codon:yes gene_type:complete